MNVAQFCFNSKSYYTIIFNFFFFKNYFLGAWCLILLLFFWWTGNKCQTEICAKYESYLLNVCIYGVLLRDRTFKGSLPPVMTNDSIRTSSNLCHTCKSFLRLTIIDWQVWKFIKTWNLIGSHSVFQRIFDSQLYTLWL